MDGFCLRASFFKFEKRVCDEICDGVVHGLVVARLVVALKGLTDYGFSVVCRGNF